MKHRHWALPAVAVAVLAAILVVRHVRRPPFEHAPSTTAGGARVEVDRVREPVVAGAFYPGDPDELAEQVDGLLAEVSPAPVPNLRGLVCPHAGYVYSGLTAAYCYKLLQGRKVDTVAVLGPSHKHRFVGVSIPAVDAYRTPLGLMLLSADVSRFANRGPFVSEPEAHRSEHSLEVQLPFLQRVVGEAKLVPMVFGQADPTEVAAELGEHLSPDTLVVASSDLSHYHPYEVARKLDRSTIDAVLALDLERMKGAQACGKGPIMALIALARHKGWQAKLLDYRNSGDTAGTRSKVVGYAAIAFHEPVPAPSAG